MVLVVAGTVAVTVAARRIPIQIPRKVMGRGRIREGQKTFIPLRLNTANVMPIIFAQSLIIVPGTIAAFSGNQTLKHLAEYFSVTSPVYLITSALLIIFFAYFYTSIIFNPVDLAENLKKQGGFIPGVKPGAPRRTTSTTSCPVSRSRGRSPHDHSDAADRRVEHVQHAVRFRRYRAAHCRGCRAGHRHAGAAAPAVAALRRVHEGRARQVPRAASSGTCRRAVFILL